MNGADEVELNPAGPVQLYCEPAGAVAVKKSEPPEQTGLLLVIVGEDGKVLICTNVLALVEVQPLNWLVTVKEYVPEFAVVTLKIGGGF